MVVVCLFLVNTVFQGTSFALAPQTGLSDNITDAESGQPELTADSLRTAAEELRNEKDEEPRDILPMALADKDTGRIKTSRGERVASCTLKMGPEGFSGAQLDGRDVAKRHRAVERAEGLVNDALAILAGLELTGERVVRELSEQLREKELDVPLEFMEDHDVLMDIAPVSQDVDHNDSFKVRVDIDTAQAHTRDEAFQQGLKVLMAVGLLHELYHRIGLNEEEALIKTIQFCKVLRDRATGQYNLLTAVLQDKSVDHGNEFSKFLQQGLNEPEETQRVLAKRLMNTWNRAARRDLMVFTKKERVSLGLDAQRIAEREKAGFTDTEIVVPRMDDKGVKLASFDVTLANNNRGASRVTSESLVDDDERVSEARSVLEGALAFLASKRGKNQALRDVSDSALRRMVERSMHLNVELVDDLDHLMDVRTPDGFFAGEDSAAVLRLDAAAIMQAAPEERRALEILTSMGVIFYFYRRMEGYTSLDAHKAMMDYYSALTEREREAVASMMRENDEYDCGDYLAGTKEGEGFLGAYPSMKKKSEEEARRRSVQMLRARSMAGEMPFDLAKAEMVLRAAEKEGADFNEETNVALFEAIKGSFDEDKAGVYYARLAENMHNSGLIVTSQRGSRVSHTQATILSAAKFAAVNISMRDKAQAVRDEVKRLSGLLPGKLKPVGSDTARALDACAGALSGFEILLHDMGVLLKKDQVAVAEVERMARRLKKANEEFLSAVTTSMEKLREEIRAANRGDLKETKRATALESLRAASAALTGLAGDLGLAINGFEESLDETELADAAFTFFVQRFSARSGHHIARLLLGRRIYIERDPTTDELRTEALSNIDIAPGPAYAVPHCTFYSENASLTVKVRDGKPYIDWPNMEQILLEIAPHCYEAIKNAEENGRPMFTYQLETTVGGTFAELIKTTLENVMTDMATIEHSLCDGVPARERAAEKEAAYKAHVRACAKEVFKNYMLTYEIAAVMEAEKVGEYEAIEIMLGTYRRDAAADIARLAVIREAEESGELRQGALESKLGSIGLRRQVARAVAEESGLLEDYSEYLRARGTSARDASEEDIDRYMRNKSRSSAFKVALYGAAYKSVLAGNRSLEARARTYLKNYVTYRHLTAARETIDEFGLDRRPHKISSEEPRKGTDPPKRFNFIVKPSRIWFGEYEVASVTSMYGQFIGGTPESVQEAIPLVKLTNSSLSCAHVFGSINEGATAKVLENTVRDIEHAAATYIGMLQKSAAFPGDGRRLREAINERKESHFLLWSAATVAGYCLTKEPIFVILMTEMQSDGILEHLGVPKEHREYIKAEAARLLDASAGFTDPAAWEEWVRQELSKDQRVREYFGDMSDTEWFPPLEAIVFLLEKMKDMGSESVARYASSIAEWATQMLKLERQINDMACVARMQDIKGAVERVRKLRAESGEAMTPLEDLRIGMQASYKGDVSDYRESANWYMYLMMTKQFGKMKNYMIDLVREVDELEARMAELRAEYQVESVEYLGLLDAYRKKVALPQYKEFAETTRLITEGAIPTPGGGIVFSDPYVPDADQFMDGALRAEADEVRVALREIGFSERGTGIGELTDDQINAHVRTYGTDLLSWPIIRTKLAELGGKASQQQASQVRSRIDAVTKENMVTLAAHAEGVGKDFFRDYQGCDVIVINSAHGELKDFFRDLPRVAQAMKVGNPSSDLVILDTSQQAQGPLLDYEAILEWEALGGVYACGDENVKDLERWRGEMTTSRGRAREFIDALASADKDEAELLLGEWAGHGRDRKGRQGLASIQDWLHETIRGQRDVAKGMGRDTGRYDVAKKAVDALVDPGEFGLADLSFGMWLALGGRFVLNGLPASEIERYQKVYENAIRQLTGRRAKRTAKSEIALFVTPEHEFAGEEYAEERARFRGTTKEGDLPVLFAASGIEQRRRMQRLLRQKAYIKNAYEETHSRLKGHLEVPASECLNRARAITQDWSTDFTSETRFSGFGDFLANARAACERYVDEFLPEGQLKPEQEELKKVLLGHLAEFFTGKDITIEQYRQLRGDHDRLKGGDIGKLAEQKGIKGNRDQLEIVASIGVLIDEAFLISQTINAEDENDLINNLSVYCDAILNIHEFDYPPFLFHYLCTNGFGFGVDYFKDPQQRREMQELSHRHYRWIYDFMRSLVVTQTDLKDKDDEYVEDLLGDYTQGTAGILYTDHDRNVSEAGVFWENMRALRDVVVMTHDRFPLPRIVKDVDSRALGMHNSVYVAVAYPPGNGTTMTGPRLNVRMGEEGVVFTEDDGTERRYAMSTGMTPYPVRSGGAAGSRLFRAPASLTFLAPEQLAALGEDVAASEVMPDERGVFTLLSFNGRKRPVIGCTMNHFTSQNHVTGRFEREKHPVAWARIAQQEMYMKVILPQILAKAGIESIPQASIPRGSSRSSINRNLRSFITNLFKETGIRAVIYKPSEQSGGRGAERFVVVNKKGQIDEAKFRELVEFAESFTDADDGVVQAFLTSSPFQFATDEFLDEAVEEFAEIGRPIDTVKIPHTPLYWYMRTFPTQFDGKRPSIAMWGKILNTEPVANYGRAGRYFEGTPERILKPEFAAQIRAKMEETTFKCLDAIEELAPEFVEQMKDRFPDLEHGADAGGISYARMLVGLFDYLPYLVYKPQRNSKGTVIHFAPTAEGGVTFYYYDKAGNIKHLDSSQEHVADLIDRGKIEIRVGVIELNSGFGLVRPHQKQLQKLGIDAGEGVLPVWHNMARRAIAGLRNRGIELPEMPAGGGVADSPADGTRPLAPVDPITQRIALATEETRALVGAEGGREVISEDDVSVILGNYARALLEERFGGADQLKENIGDPEVRARIIGEAADILKGDRAEVQAGLKTLPEFAALDTEPMVLRMAWSEGFIRRAAECAVDGIQMTQMQQLRVSSDPMSIEEFDRAIGERQNVAVFCGTLTGGTTNLMSALIADSAAHDDENHGELHRNVLGVLWDKGWVVRSKDKILVKKAIVYDSEKKILREVEFPRPLELDSSTDLAMTTNLPQEKEADEAAGISRQLRHCGIVLVNPEDASGRADDKYRTYQLLKGRVALPKTVLVSQAEAEDADAIQAKLKGLQTGRTSAARLDVVIKPNTGTEAEGAAHFAGRPGTTRDNAQEHIEGLLTAGRDVLVQSTEGTARFFSPAQAEQGRRRFVLRLNTTWSGEGFTAESGYANVAGNEDDANLTRSRGAEIIDINAALQGIQYQDRNGDWVDLELTPEHIALIRQVAVDAAGALNRDLSEDDMLKFMGIDIALNITESENGTVVITPVVLEANARPSGLSRSAEISDTPVPAGYPSTPSATKALWRLADTVERDSGFAGRNILAAAASAIAADRPDGQVDSILAQMDDLRRAARDQEFDAGRRVGVGISGGRLRRLFMHPDMARFFGPALQESIGGRDARDWGQVAVMIQSTDDGKVHLSTDNTLFKETAGWVSADKIGAPGEEIDNWDKYADFGLAMTEQLLGSLNYVTPDQLSRMRDAGADLPPETRWAQNNMRRTIALIANSIASLRTVRTGPAGERIQEALKPENFKGLNICINGNVPTGGFSSSSAVVVAVLNALDAYYDLQLTDDEIVSVACQAEYGTGVRAGSLDQASEQKGRSRGRVGVSLLLSSNPSENYRTIGVYELASEDTNIFFPYSVRRDVDTAAWSAGYYAAQTTPEGKLSSGDIRKFGKTAAIAAVLVELPLEESFFQHIEEELVADGVLSAETLARVYGYLRQIPLSATVEEIKEMLRAKRDWYADRLMESDTSLSRATALEQTDEYFGQLTGGLQTPSLDLTDDAGQVQTQTGVPLRALLAYLYGEVATNMHLLKNQDQYIDDVSRSQRGDRCFDIELGQLPGREEMEDTDTKFPWEGDLSGPELMEVWLGHCNATPFNFNKGLDDDSLDATLTALSDGTAPEEAQLHLLEGGNFFRGLALIDLAEAMLKKAFGEQAVAVRVNAAGQGDFFQVHVDARQANPADVKRFIEKAIYKRFGLTPKQKFAEIFPGGPAVGITVKLGRIAQLSEDLRPAAPAIASMQTAHPIVDGGITPGDRERMLDDDRMADVIYEGAEMRMALLRADEQTSMSRKAALLDFMGHMEKIGLEATLATGDEVLTLVQRSMRARHVRAVLDPRVSDLVEKYDAGNVERLGSLLEEQRVKGEHIGLITSAKLLLDNMGVREALERLAVSETEFTIAVDCETEEERNAILNLNLPGVKEARVAKAGESKRDRAEALTRFLRSKRVLPQFIGMADAPVEFGELAEAQRAVRGLDIYVGIPTSTTSPLAGSTVSVHGVLRNVIDAVASQRKEKVFRIDLPPIEIPTTDHEWQEKLQQFEEAIEYLKHA